MELSHDDVKKILEIIDASKNLEEVEVAYGGFLLRIQRSGGAEAPANPRARVQAPPRAAPAAPPPSKAARTELVLAPGEVAVRAPMLGTFYRAEAPGKPPFVEVGAKVESDTIVCIIEVMKMMNSVPAGLSGTITEVLPENAELVEYGQPLFRVKPE